MANFSSFFPVAASGGGGGFTKMKKISTLNSADATDIKKPDVTLNVNGNQISGATVINVFYMDSSLGGTIMQNADSFVGHTFVYNSTTHTITASTSHSNWGYAFNITFSPALTTSINTSVTLSTVAASPTINPSSDLGLSDGDSIGYLLAGGNATGVLRGAAIISNASTDLVLTPGVSSGTASTISGGLTLTSADGTLSNSIGYLDTVENSGYSSFMRTRVAAGQGIDGYGVGQQFSGTQTQGYGGYGKDGAVLLFY